MASIRLFQRMPHPRVKRRQRPKAIPNLKTSLAPNTTSEARQASVARPEAMTERPTTHASELQPLKPTPPNTGNSATDKKYTQQQDKLAAKQTQDHEKLQQQQEKEHQQATKKNYNDTQNQQDGTAPYSANAASLSRSMLAQAEADGAASSRQSKLHKLRRVIRLRKSTTNPMRSARRRKSLGGAARHAFGGIKSLAGGEPRVKDVGTHPGCQLTIMSGQPSSPRRSLNSMRVRRRKRVLTMRTLITKLLRRH